MIVFTLLTGFAKRYLFGLFLHLYLRLFLGGES